MKTWNRNNIQTIKDIENTEFELEVKNSHSSTVRTTIKKQEAIDFIRELDSKDRLSGMIATRSIKRGMDNKVIIFDNTSL